MKNDFQWIIPNDRPKSAFICKIFETKKNTFSLVITNRMGEAEEEEEKKSKSKEERKRERKTDVEWVACGN